MKIGIKNLSNNPLPAYATVGSSGLDVRANITEPITLKSLDRYLVPTGIFLEMPTGYEAQMRPRSGMAVKQGLTCLNSPGTIDSDYRGELKVLLVNLSNEPQTINHGERIAQIVFARVEIIEWNETMELSETQRGEGGFGHTGKS
jgi:dUTP pyrophosphatase